MMIGNCAIHKSYVLYTLFRHNQNNMRQQVSNTYRDRCVVMSYDDEHVIRQIFERIHSMSDKCKTTFYLFCL